MRKRHRAWANTKQIGALDRGCLRAAARKKCVLKTTIKKKKGDKVTYSGTKHLKSTQLEPQCSHSLQRHGFCVCACVLDCCHVLACSLLTPVCAEKDRSYPIAFGLRVQRLLPRLCKGGSGRPILGPDLDAPRLFAQMAEEDWAEADVMASVKYIRGSKTLNVPERWKSIFPNTWTG
jgi:hypothetical protein